MKSNETSGYQLIKVKQTLGFHVNPCQNDCWVLWNKHNTLIAYDFALLVTDKDNYQVTQISDDVWNN